MLRRVPDDLADHAEDLGVARPGGRNQNVT